ncbi:hypothetical protein HYFRA_00006679 [Hymenoscyphus fraxineus]|uniref:Asl1-like glycosyl hydrolase catalytic domain-containing protein n=1 Tax=Hymenoscyphus fraxineus TaxID=746836 RepID=A0A9N9KYG0_9HELO|nr:hypothetical protein HYFRA_00006679 [Hymenoscyphus fraxineus]
MRSSTLSSIAFLATSLLVKDVVAAPGAVDIRKRENYIIQVQEEVVVSRGTDGKYTTGKPVAVATVTVPASAPTPVVEDPKDTPKVVDPPKETPSSKPIKVVEPTTKPETKDPKPTSQAPPPPKPTSEAPKPTTEAPKPTPEAPKPTTAAPKPTTLVTSAAPPSEPSEEPVAAAAKVQAASGGAKRGVAYNDGKLVKVISGSSWAYNWAATSGGGLPSGVEYVPLLWGDQADKTNGWNDNVQKAISAGSKHVLGFNEPDLGSQAHMSVDASVTAWKKWLQPLAGKVKLGSPAVTNGNSQQEPYMGIPYLKQFLSRCSGCTIDFVVIHWYNNNPLDSAVQYFKDHVKEAHDVTGKPVWITEFAYTGGDEAAFLKKVIPWLEAQAYVERYSYFMAAEGKLVSGGGLSTVGKAYVA